MIAQDSLGLENYWESFNPSDGRLRTIIDTIPRRVVYSGRWRWRILESAMA
jgi:hypothetical protein